MVCVILYMHQTSGASAGMWGCNRMHQMEKTDYLLLISSIFFFLSCHENAHDNKEFHCENSKPCCESHITTCELKP